MNTSLTTRENRELERESALARLADEVNQAHLEFVVAARTAVCRALDAGRSLLTAKDVGRKGTFTAWLAANFEFSSSTAHDYMRLADWVKEAGDDPQCIAGLSFSQAIRMLRGRRGSDGRASPRRLPEADPSASCLPPPATQPLPPAERAAAAADSPEPAPTAVAAALPASTADPFDTIVRMLGELVVELRRLMETSPQHARYARHLMQPLERIRGGVAGRRWFWDLIKR